MYAVHVISEWIKRAILFLGMKREAEATTDATVIAKEEELRLNFVQRNFALIRLTGQRISRQGRRPHRMSIRLKFHQHLARAERGYRTVESLLNVNAY